MSKSAPITEHDRRTFFADYGNRFCACGCGRRADTVMAGRPRSDRSKWQPFAFGCVPMRAENKGSLGGMIRHSPLPTCRLRPPRLL
jgi:hypothetical protein